MVLSNNLFLVISVAILFRLSQSQNCQKNDGSPGKAGITGRDGRPGQKGEKGESGLQVKLSKEALMRLKGDRGEDGPIGELGPQGFNGTLGPPGPAGDSGPPGPQFSNNGATHAKKAAFSVMSTKGGYPKYNSPVIFDKAVVNVNNDFDLTHGYFTCSVSGVYYFVFHVVSDGNLCLKLRSDRQADPNLAFCDFNQRKGNQVLSGGAVIQLVQGNKVWIEPFKNNDRATVEYNQMTNKNVFNGFLIFES